MLAELTSLIEAAEPRCGPVRVVAVDGGAAAGKSSLAAALVLRLDGAAVLSTDAMLDGWAGQFSFWPRLRTDVLAPLAAGRPGSYQRYDWHAMRFAETVAVPVPRVLLVEGVSAITACADRLSVAIFLDVPRAVRERRLIERDGPLQQPWRNWLDNEDRYFTEHPAPPGTVLLDDAVPLDHTQPLDVTHCAARAPAETGRSREVGPHNAAGPGAGSL